MKPAPFDYVVAQSIDQACALLAQDVGARPIAGGQTLIPMLAMRLARPTKLVDLAAIPGLSSVTESRGYIEIGAMTRQAEVEHMQIVAESLPLLALAMPWVGHAPTRARGTIGGSIANADPAAEIPLVAVTLGADIVVATPDGENIIPATDFFIAAMVTALPVGGLVKAIRFPVVSGASAGYGFAEVNARSSDFAFAAAAAQIELDEEGFIHQVMLGIGGVADVPVRLDLSGLIGERPVAEAIACAAREEIAELDAFDDLHASAAYRRRSAAVLAKRAIDEALIGITRAPS